MVTLKDCVNRKIEYLRKSIVDEVSWYQFSPTVDRSHFAYGEYSLECQFLLHDGFYHRTVTTQDIIIKFELFKIFDRSESRESLEEEARVFYYTPELKGWASPLLYEQPTKKELQVLFRNRDNSKFYDLTNTMRTDSLVDMWFQRLLSKSTETIERYL